MRDPRCRLVLASASHIRRHMLEAAGLRVEVVPADIDERALEQGLGNRDPARIAVALAIAKGHAVSPAEPGAVVISADQTLALGGRLLTKPETRGVALQQLMDLSGRTHTLQSAAAVVRNGALLWSGCTMAQVTMRPFAEAFAADYLDRAGPQALTSVGAYQLEGLGVQLLERVEGDHFTVLGLPLLALLAALRAHRIIDG